MSSTSPVRFAVTLTALLAIAGLVSATPLAAPVPVPFAKAAPAPIPNPFAFAFPVSHASEDGQVYTMNTGMSRRDMDTTASLINIVSGSPDPTADSVEDISVTANIGQVWNIQWTAGNGYPVAIALGNRTWDMLIFASKPATPGSYNWTVTLPAGVTSGRYAFGIAQQYGSTEYSPAFEILVPQYVNGTWTTDKPAQPSMTTWYDPKCGCHHTSSMPWSKPTTLPTPTPSTSTWSSWMTASTATPTGNKWVSTMVSTDIPSTTTTTPPPPKTSIWWDEKCSCHKTAMHPAGPSVTVTVGSCQVANPKNGTVGGSCPGTIAKNGGGNGNYTLPETHTPLSPSGNGGGSGSPANSGSGTKYTGQGVGIVVPMMQLAGASLLGCVLLFW